jgi:hypothetical protein
MNIKESSNNETELLRVYDLRYKDRIILETPLPIPEVISIYKEKYTQDFEKYNLKHDFEINPKNIQKNNKMLEDLVSTLTFCYSGHICTKDDIVYYKDLVKLLTQKHKAPLPINFQFGTLIYLIIAFKLKRNGRSHEESNNINDAVKLLTELLTHEELKVRTILCSHREASDINKNTLVENFLEASLVRVTSMLKGIIENSPVKFAKVTFYQATPLFQASTYVFPQMFLNYMENGEVDHFFTLLGAQFNQLQKGLSNYSTERVSFSAVPLQEFYSTVESKVAELFGKQWRELNEWSQVSVDTPLKESILEIAREITSPSIARLMPYFELKPDLGDISSKIKLNQEKIVNDSNRCELIQNSINWFYITGKLNMVTKSLLETMFYYTWGELAKQEDEIGFGLDRDHDEYQTMSWALGYNGSYFGGNYIPLLYAKRLASKDEIPGGTLNEISFRQFWRFSIS